MFCWKCGEENPDGARFCKKCGAAFEKEPDKNVRNNKSENVFGQYKDNNKVQWKNVFGSKKKIIILSTAVVAAVLVLIIGVSSAVRNGAKAKVGSTMTSETSTHTTSVENEKSTKDTTSAETGKNEKGTTSTENKINANVGGIIKFGHYEQDDNTSNGAEPIEWQVISTRDGYTALLSKYVLDCKRYNESKKDVTWEKCSLRSWLNNDFYNTAFSASEKKRIATVHNENLDSYELYKSLNQGAEGGKATDDKVFLLSWTEARDYFGGKFYDSGIGEGNYNPKLLCKPTAYAKSESGWLTIISNKDNKYPSDAVGCCDWWLRSPGHIQRWATIVYGDGTLRDSGVYDGLLGVRPVIFIDGLPDQQDRIERITGYNDFGAPNER